jgi:hypothetical protein
MSELEQTEGSASEGIRDSTVKLIAFAIFSLALSVLAGNMILAASIDDFYSPSRLDVKLSGSVSSDLTGYISSDVAVSGDISSDVAVSGRLSTCEICQ